MPEYIQEYNFNSVYISLLLIMIYNIWHSNDLCLFFINLYQKCILLNYNSLLLLIIIIGFYMILTKITIEIKWTIKYN